ncbi:beta-defensin antibiotic precursor antimicrobial defensin beta signal defensin bd-32 defb-32 [Lucifera butyrica]|uniref:Beta-defensin antibiotic antimicrobial defensin beta signal defensin bd-32 defb-32 n=1 Tax=Lucifera butyrica TaxID=1351585 RepID=A0A498R779_9FIRM|nr:tryptophan transporter [Lucifera butyrica]VBB06780.1 beta-defensin antibiotic precursor antimicrobial defensin beta signal defensin bd-32 defb-32 [Lucifera butyrica]
METKPNEPEMTIYEKNKGGTYRWITVSVLLLAIGAILHLISPSVGGITPNWTIAMYCLAINLTRPTIGQAFGIGLVAAAINVPTSKSAFPYGNLLSEPVGAVVCALLVALSYRMMLGNLNLKPAITGFISTVASGLTFITTLKLVLSLPMAVYLYAMLPVVFVVAALNAVITQVLYFPAKKLFDGKGRQSCQP